MFAVIFNILTCKIKNSQSCVNPFLISPTKHRKPRRGTATVKKIPVGTSVNFFSFQPPGLKRGMFNPLLQFLKKKIPKVQQVGESSLALKIFL